MIHGIINVRKEKGFTSHDVVAKLRGITKQKKIGHTGTLDPDAEGVLPVCFGKATKLCDMLTDKEKEYEAVLLLGKETDTQDISGTVLRECGTSEISEEEAAAAARSFEGSYEQIPPMYSALKVNGKKLCDLARDGITVERKARRVEIKQIEILEIDLPRIRFRTVCSKGTYIRTLCHDIGRKLGCGGCMETLLRTRSGMFALSDSRRLSEIERLWKEDGLSGVLIPIDAMFADAVKVYVKAGQEKSVYNGNALKPEQLEEKTGAADGKDGERIRVYGTDGVFLALYRYCGKERRYKVEKMFYSPE